MTGVQDRVARGLATLGAVVIDGNEAAVVTLDDEAGVVPSAPPGGRVSRAIVEVLEPTRLARARRAFSTRRVPPHAFRTLVSGAVRPRAGDLVLARIERVRQHPRIELPTGRRATLHAGDEVIVACGNRYASDQFEAFVPESLGAAHLVAGGGVAATMVERARGMRPATEVTLLGLLADDEGVPVNLARFALPEPRVEGPRPPVMAVFGTAMNSGKTTTAGALIHGLERAGYRVGYAKLTGTGSGNDYWQMVDAGAAIVADFTDAGLVSTYMAPLPVLEDVGIHLIGHLAANGCERIVVEIADGLLQRETAGLLHSEVLHSLVDRVLFAAVDAMAAAGGVALLRAVGFDVAGVSGLLTASPLPLREARAAVDVPVFTRDELSDPEAATLLLRADALIAL